MTTPKKKIEPDIKINDLKPAKTVKGGFTIKRTVGYAPAKPNGPTAPPPPPPDERGR